MRIAGQRRRKKMLNLRGEISMAFVFQNPLCTL
jgi:hypothetical protein